MDKDLIKENLKLIRNSEDVNYIIATKKDKNMYLVAGLTSGKEIPLTRAIAIHEFPSLPMLNIRRAMGFLYMEDFVSICDGFGCINRNNFASLDSKVEENPKYIDMLATFKNGKTINLYATKAKNFEKEKDRLMAKLAKNENEFDYYDDSFLGW